jgi:hypothetical protein
MICQDVRRDLALAAAGALEPASMTQVHEHCRRCEACAARLHQLQGISSAHSKASGEVQGLPLRFEPAPRPDMQPVRHQFKSPLDWVNRWLLPIGTAAALILGVLMLQRALSTHPVTTVAPVAHQTRHTPPPTSPTLAAYRSALNEPGDASLDALLSRHAQHLLPGTSDQELRQVGREL